MTREPLIHFDRVVLTQGVLDRVSAAFVNEALGLFAHGDWGDVDAEDAAKNDAEARTGGYLLGAYVPPEGQGPRFWIERAPGGPVTVTLPEER
jgi:hypothetical protein